MASFFTNETPGAIVAPNATGICPGSINIPAIADGKVGSSDLGKLCSSMPSPLARLYLGSAAFKEVNAMEAMAGVTGVGHKGMPTIDPVTNSYDCDNLIITPYHMIVNEILDLLEFIYKNGGDSRRFTIKRWDLAVETTKLIATRHDSHTHLAVALQSAIQTGNNLGNNANISTIYLFYWDNHVIGGTTPFSLVYTSANLRDLVAQGIFDGKLSGNNNNQLFSGNITPLAERDPNFRLFMYRFQSQITNSSPLINLAKYIRDAGGNYTNDTNQADWVLAQQTPTDTTGLTPLLLNRAQANSAVIVAGIQLMVTDHSVNINGTTCDYIIKPTVNQAVGSKLPLVLDEYGVTGLTYYKREWKPGLDVIPDVLPDDINDRKLPTWEAKYPFLVVSDFLEERIVEVGYDINNHLFETCCDESLRFLLPIKRRFFDYFKPSDLASMMKITQDKEGSDVVEVTVNLTIPLVNGHSITLTRIYNVNQAVEDRPVVDCFDGSNTFSLAIFPFYKFVSEAAVQKNVYNVLLGATRPGVKLNFFNGNVAVKAESYDRADLPDYKSTHYHISKKSFNLIEVSIEDNGEQRCGFAIPKFREIANEATSEFCFSVDFGTTNTFVAYKQDGSAVQAFNYDESEMQVGVLGNDNGSSFTKFPSLLKREFVPKTISDSNNSEAECLKFPMRTATYEVGGGRQTLELFSHCCIGFNYGERSSQVTKLYRTNIKWSRDSRSQSRIGVFFHELIWMMKNKSVLNNGGTKFKLAVTWPISMGDDPFECLKGSVATAIEESGCDVTPIFLTESEAPYYVNIHNGSIDFGRPYVNMDIGGGTTDILYYNKESGSQFVLSAFFAANDLWNDGVQVMSGSKRNGILKYYQRAANLDDGCMSSLNDIIQGAADSADVISYLFSDEKKWQLSNVICDSKYIRMLPVIHFSALAYYLAYSLYMANEKAPDFISFTGMGSKYIRLVSQSEKTIAALFNAMFNYVSKTLEAPELGTNKIKVIFVDKPKEVTARGALITINAAKAALIHPQKELFYGYDNESGKALTGKGLDKDLRSKVLSFFKSFLEVFNDEDYAEIIHNKLALDINSEVISLLWNHAESSYDLCETKLNCAENSKVKEPLFFWPLKDSLCKLSEYLCQKEPK
ncbi:MAG: hypothetical protein ACI4AM_02735 [Muribaculaceae bacterium]